MPEAVLLQLINCCFVQIHTGTMEKLEVAIAVVLIDLLPEQSSYWVLPRLSHENQLKKLSEADRASLIHHLSSIFPYEQLLIDRLFPRHELIYNPASLGTYLEPQSRLPTVHLF